MKKTVFVLLVFFSIKVAAQTSELVNNTFMKLKNDYNHLCYFYFLIKVKIRLTSETASNK
jgi:hypothetical protein